MTFLHSFFSACGCTILNQTNQSLSIQLTEDADRSLMNRPFYWHYKDKLQQKGEPLAITFFTEDPGRPLKQMEEYINFGSPRFHQLLSYAQKNSSFVKLYEQCETNGILQLEPWLFVNFHLSYEANGKKEKIVPFALHLISGRITKDFSSKLPSLSLEQTISPYHYVLSPLITPVSGVKRLLKFLMNELEGENHEWASIAKEKQKNELLLLRSFFDETAEENEQFQREKAAIVRRFEPVIRISVLNGGLFYLSRQHND